MDKLKKRFRFLAADFAFASVFTLCGILCVLVFLYQSDTQTKQQSNIQLSIAEHKVSHISYDIGLTLQNIDAGLRTVFNAATHKPVQPETLRNALNNAPYLNSISLLDPQGKIIASTKETNIGGSLDINLYPVYPQPTGDLLRIGPTHRGHDLVDGVPLTDNAKNTPEQGFIPIIHTRLSEDNAQEITLVATLDLGYLLQRVASIPANTSATRIAVLRTDGVRMIDTMQTDASLLMLERETVERWHKGDFVGASEWFSETDSRHWIVAYRLHPQLPVGVILAVDRDSLLKDAFLKIQRNNMTIILLMIVGMICVLFGYLFFRHASRHQREQVARIEARRSLLESSLNACTSAIVITKPDGLIEWSNPAFSALTGYTAAEASGQYPNTLCKSGKQNSAFYAHMWKTIRSGRVWRGELVNRRKDGSLYDELLTIAPALDSEGVIQHFIGTKEDFTQQKAAREELEIMHSHLNAVVENFPGSLIMEDLEGRIVLLNQCVFELLGLPGTEEYVLGKPVQPLMVFSSHVAEDGQAFLDRIADLRATGRPSYGEEIHFKDGRWIERDFIPIHLHENRIGFLYIYRDISQRKRHARELWQLATSDPLTGIPNRRAFFESIERERTRLTRYPGEAGVLMIDIDHFKQINDTYGHAAGDAVLCHIVRQSRKLLRESDMLARLGGEEFAVLLPQTNREGALGLAERIRTVLEDTPLTYNDKPIRVTASVGVTIMSHADPSIDKTLSRADNAMYEAKHKGRNRVEIG
ncbi:MAG: diguanylate cyclase [Azoarcus sp.]|jgi:diguanylate cyclase (GGDEF)-like protein/PAS domain S-box-containing protein|nr:diguanylate cyclase [Azoarcus sp.]